MALDYILHCIVMGGEFGNFDVIGLQHIVGVAHLVALLVAVGLTGAADYRPSFTIGQMHRSGSMIGAWGLIDWLHPSARR